MNQAHKFTLADCEIQESEEFITLSPSRPGREGTVAFDRSVKEFLRTNLDYEVQQAHPASQAGLYEWDYVLLRRPRLAGSQD